MQLRVNRSDERGSAMVMSLIAVLVMMTLISTFVMGSVTESRGVAGSLDNTQSWFNSHSGVWAAAHHLANGGDGSDETAVSGFTAVGTYTDDVAMSTLIDIDGDLVGETAVATDLVPPDGFYDFSHVDYIRAQGDGYYEARCNRIDAENYFVRAMAVEGDTIRTLQGVLRLTNEFNPFALGAFGKAGIALNSDATIDSWHSGYSTYDAAPTFVDPGNSGFPIKMSAETGVTEPLGAAGSNGDIDLNSNSSVYGDATAGGNVNEISGSAHVEGTSTSSAAPLSFDNPTWTIPSTSNNGNITIDTGSGPQLMSAFDAGMAAHNSTLFLVGGSTGKAKVKIGPGDYVFSAAGFKDIDVELYGNSGDEINIYITHDPGTDPNASIPNEISSTHGEGWGDYYSLGIIGETEFVTGPSDAGKVDLAPDPNPGDGKAEAVKGPVVNFYITGRMYGAANATLGIDDTAANLPYTAGSGNPGEDDGTYMMAPEQMFIYIAHQESSSDYAANDDGWGKAGFYWSSNADISAVIYAPNTNMSFNSNNSIFGAVVGNRIDMNSNTFIHYDEALADIGVGSQNAFYVPEMLREIR